MHSSWDNAAKLIICHDKSENNDLFHKGKNLRTSDLLFDWFEFDQTSKYNCNSIWANQLNPNKKGGGPYSDTSPFEMI